MPKHFRALKFVGLDGRRTRFEALARRVLASIQSSKTGQISCTRLSGQLLGLNLISRRKEGS